MRAAARQQCQLLVFHRFLYWGVIIRDVPFLPHPSLAVRPALLCCNDLANDHHSGLPVEYNDRFIRGIAVFAPGEKHQGSTIRVMVHVWAVVPNHHGGR